MKIEIVRISLLVNMYSGDKLVLYTDLPEGGWPYKGKASLDMTVAKGKGVEYCAEHFPGVPVKVIDTWHHEEPCPTLPCAKAPTAR